jgi:hypothetical protein
MHLLLIGNILQRFFLLQRSSPEVFTGFCKLLNFFEKAAATRDSLVGARGLNACVKFLRRGSETSHLPHPVGEAALPAARCPLAAGAKGIIGTSRF